MVQNANWPISSWQANFVAGVHDPEPVAWDELSPDMLGPTARVVGYSTELGIQFELNAAESGTGTVKCRNIDEWLNPANTGSPWNSAGKLLKPYRRIRHWMAWPLSGNLLNAANDRWTAARSGGTLADTAGFEGATTGTWTPVAGCTAASSTAHAHDGSRGMLVTWATTSGGANVAETAAVSVPLKGGTTYTASLWVYIGSGPAVTLNCQGQTATSTSTTGAWQRVTLTWTANNQTTDLRLYAAGSTTSGQQVWVDSVQVEAVSSASTWGATGSTIYPVHSGYIERYPLTWTDAGKQGWAELTSVDALALLSRIILQDVATQDCLQDKPLHLWSLRDEKDTAAAVNAGTATTVLALTPVGAPKTVTTTLGASDGPGVDKPSCCTFTPATPSDGYALVADWSTAPITGPYTAEGWFTAATVTRQMRVCGLRGAALEELAVQVTAAGLVQLVHTNSGGTVDATVTTAGAYVDSAWHHWAVTAHGDGTTVWEELFVDGQSAGTTARTSAATMTVLGLVAGYARNQGTDSWIGSLAGIAVYPARLASARIQSHWLAARTGFAGDTTDVRIGRLLAWTGWTGQVSLPAGASRHGPMVGLGGGSVSVLDAIKVAEVTERGTFYAAQDGRLTLVPRSAYCAQTTASRTFGEDATGGEAPYLVAAAELDPTYVYNSITVTRAGGAAQVVADLTSQSSYGVRTTSVTTSHVTDADAASLGAYLVTQYADGHLRVPELTINPAANPALWPVALGTRFGDRVTWKRRTSAGVTITLDGFVERIHHDVGPGKWDAKFQISPVDTYQSGLIGDSTYGLIGSTLISTY